MVTQQSLLEVWGRPVIAACFTKSNAGASLSKSLAYDPFATLVNLTRVPSGRASRDMVQITETPISRKGPNGH